MTDVDRRGRRYAQKPANFDALAEAARQGDGEAFAAEHGRYRDQCNRDGVHPGTLIGWLDDDGTLS